MAFLNQTLQLDQWVARMRQPEGQRPISCIFAFAWIVRR